MELVIPSPSGSQGVYVLRWASIPALCRPTLHDRELSRRIIDEDSVSPSSIRRAARQVAVEGLAGEDAREAAVAAEQDEKREQVLTNYRLVMALVAQLGLSSQNGAAIGLAGQAQVAVDRVSSQLNKTTAWTAAALERIAGLMSGIGQTKDGASSRVPRLLTLLEECRSDMLSWSAGEKDADCQSHAQIVGSLAEVTLSISAAMLVSAREFTDDVVRMLRCWADDPGELSRCLARPEWMLDGWEQICLLWRHTEDRATRRVALAEIASMIPVLPKEASDWCRDVDKHNDVLRHRKFIQLHEDWLTGVLDVERVSRNEHLRAISCRMQSAANETSPQDRWTLPSFTQTPSCTQAKDRLHA